MKFKSKAGNDYEGQGYLDENFVFQRDVDFGDSQGGGENFTPPTI